MRLNFFPFVPQRDAFELSKETMITRNKYLKKKKCSLAEEKKTFYQHNNIWIDLITREPTSAQVRWEVSKSCQTCAAAIDRCRWAPLSNLFSGRDLNGHPAPWGEYKSFNYWQLLHFYTRMHNAAIRLEKTYSYSLNCKRNNICFVVVCLFVCHSHHLTCLLTHLAPLIFGSRTLFTNILGFLRIVIVVSRWDHQHNVWQIAFLFCFVWPSKWQIF